MRVSVQRDVVDYALQRRALLGDVASGRRARAEACDAHPYLLLAARHYGEPVPEPVPGLRSTVSSTSTTSTARRSGKISGQAKSPAELDAVGRQPDEFDVYVVEVCPDCGWNHLVRSFVLGRPEDRR